MDELTIPPAPLWYKSSVVACAPDNTLIYGSKNDIVVFNYKGPKVPAEVKFITSAHTKNLLSVSLNKSWNEPNRHVVSLGEDNVIKVWDLNTFQQKCVQKGHVGTKDDAVGAIFAGDDRVVSVSSSGVVFIWNINTDEVKVLAKLFDTKVTVTCLAACPHANHLTAFGLYNGCIVVADLRRKGWILHRLRGHTKPVNALSWCPAPVNIFPRYNWNTVGNKLEENTKTEAQQVDIEKPKSRTNPWVNLVHADDNEIKPESEIKDQNAQYVDFLAECANLKNKILGVPETAVKAESSDKSIDGESSEKDEDCDEKAESENTKEVAARFEEARSFPAIFDPSCDFTDDLVDFSEKPLSSEINASDSGIIVEADQNICNNELNTDDCVVNKTREPIVEEPRHEYLLASIGSDKAVYIWRGGTDGRMQTFFSVASKRKSQKQGRSKDAWLALLWITPNKILTSSENGELLQWQLPLASNSDKNRFYKIIHIEHIVIFNIVAPVVYFNKYNWLQPNYSAESSIWTTDKHWHIENFDLVKNESVYNMQTVSSTITCIDASPLDPNNIGLGVRDAKIFMWDLSRPSVNHIKMIRYHKNISGKLTSISWHPHKDMILAFGTDEGRVGFIDKYANKTVLLPHYFTSSVHLVQWGPTEGDRNKLSLYAIADGKIIYYDVKDVKDAPSLLDLPDKYYFKFAWKPDFSILLVNGKDGSILVLSPDLKVITTLYIYKKGLLSIVWHPEAIGSDVAKAPHCNWFAATTSTGIIVYDCDVKYEGNPMEKIVANLEGHLKPPASLAWSPFDPLKLVTASPDGLCHVWDIAQKAIIATYVNDFHNFNPVVTWSPLDPDLIIFADHIITIWRISKHPPKADEDFLDERKKAIKTNPTADPENSSKEKKGAAKIKTPKNCIVPALFASNDANFEAQVANMRALMSKNIQSEDPLGIFGDKAQFLELLTATYNNNKKQGKHKYCTLSSLWKGDIVTEIKEAINENRVTPTILSVAPMVSLKLWQDACEVYAKKLLEETDSDPMEIAMYFLACHKVEEAIESLCINQMYREAVALAKCRFPEDSPLISEVIEKWAVHCVCTGNFEVAAQCYISIAKYEEAAKMLARRENKIFLEFAVELAEKANNKELAEALKFKCTETAKDKDIEKPLESDTEFGLLNRADALLENLHIKSDNESENTELISVIKDLTLEEKKDVEKIISSDKDKSACCSKDLDTNSKCCEDKHDKVD